MLHRLIIVAALAGLALVVACTGELDSSLTDFEVGDCIKDPSIGTGQSEVVFSLDRVDCSEPGVLRVTQVFQVTQYDDFPGDAALASLVSSRCPLATFSLAPTEESWNGADDREVDCFE